jgi:hypothetical protein
VSLSGKVIAADDTVDVASTDLLSYEAASGIPIISSGFLWEVRPGRVVGTGQTILTEDYYGLIEYSAEDSGASATAKRSVTGETGSSVPEATVSKTFTVVTGYGKPRPDVGADATGYTGIYDIETGRGPHPDSKPRLLALEHHWYPFSRYLSEFLSGESLLGFAAVWYRSPSPH